MRCTAATPSPNAVHRAAGVRGRRSPAISPPSPGARAVADQVNRLGRFDAVIHNAGVGYREPRVETADGLPQVFAVNTARPVHPDRADRKARAGSSISARACTAAPRLASTTSSGREPGLARCRSLCREQAARRADRLRVRPPLARRAVERAWSRAGWRPAWAAPGAPDDTDQGYRHAGRGWRSATIRRRASPVDILSPAPTARPNPPPSATSTWQDRLLAACARLSGVALPD